MADDLIKLSLKEAADKIQSREISSVELTQSLLDRIDARNKDINAFVRVEHDAALAMADSVAVL